MDKGGKDVLRQTGEAADRVAGRSRFRRRCMFVAVVLIAVVMSPALFNPYVDSLDDTAKLDLYRVLASGDRGAIRAREKKIEETVLGDGPALSRDEAK